MYTLKFTELELEDVMVAMDLLAREYGLDHVSGSARAKIADKLAFGPDAFELSE